MEERRSNEEADLKAPLLTWWRNNSVRSMRGQFLARLPDKLRCLVDPEEPSSLDLSLAKNLHNGIFSFFFLFLNFPCIHIIYIPPSINISFMIFILDLLSDPVIVLSSKTTFFLLLFHFGYPLHIFLMFNPCYFVNVHFFAL